MPPRPARVRSIAKRVTVKRLARGFDGKRVWVHKPLLSTRFRKRYISAGEKTDNNLRSIGEFKENLSHSREVLGRVGPRAERAMDNMIRDAFEAFKQGKITRRALERDLKDVSKKRADLQERAASQLRRLNERDSMITSLFNKNTFIDKVMPQFFSRHKNAALVVIDIDHFKNINTALGRIRADDAIRLFGQCVNEAARKHYGFGGRWGGDEMWVVLPNGVEDARAFSEYLNKILLARFKEKTFQDLKGREFTFSGGVALAREGTIDQVSKLADARSYISKGKRNRITLPGSRGLVTYRVRK